MCIKMAAFAFTALLHQNSDSELSWKVKKVKYLGKKALASQLEMWKLSFLGNWTGCKRESAKKGYLEHDRNRSSTSKSRKKVERKMTKG